MANIQYIGARYVPIVFKNPDDGSAAWKSGISYENLVIVTYLDDSYTSRKPVPSSIGNPASNPDYWAKTGDFNAALTNVQNEINTINNVTIPKMNRLAGHDNIICIGDSYLSYSAYEQENESWGAWLRAFRGTTKTTTLNGLGSAGFVGRAAKTFLQLLQEVVVSDVTEISDIIVVGGMNDLAAVVLNETTWTDVTNAIKTFINYVYSTFPNAHLYIGFCGWMAHGFSTNDGTRETFIPHMPTGIAKYKQCVDVDVHGICSYIEGLENVMPPLATSLYKADRIHPTINASNRIARAIYNYIESGSCDIAPEWYGNMLFTPSGIAVSSNTNTTGLYADNGMMCLDGGEIAITTNNETINSLTEYEIGEISAVALQGTAAHTLKIPVNCAVFPSRSPGHSYDIVPAQLRIANGVMKLYFLLNPTDGGFSGVTSISIFVPSQHYNILSVC